MPLDPQQDPGRVGDGEDMLVIAGALAEQFVKHGQCRRQRMPGPVVIQLVTIHPDGRQATPVLAGARGHAALPGASDDGAHEGRHAVRRGKLLMRSSQPQGGRTRVLTCPQRELTIRMHRSPQFSAEPPWEPPFRALPATMIASRTSGT